MAGRKKGAWSRQLIGSRPTNVSDQEFAKMVFEGDFSGKLLQKRREALTLKGGCNRKKKKPLRRARIRGKR